MASLVDTFIVFKFIKLLSSKWEDTDAFKVGAIDADGNFLKKTKEMKTPEEKKAFSKFHVLVFKLKQLLEKVPLGKVRIASLAAALFLLKEEFEPDEDKKLFERAVWNYIKDKNIQPRNLTEHVICEGDIKSGEYKLKSDVVTPDGDVVKKNEFIVVKNTTKPVDKVLGTEVFKLKTKTGKTVVVSMAELEKRK